MTHPAPNGNGNSRPPPKSVQTVQVAGLATIAVLVVGGQVTGLPPPVEAIVAVVAIVVGVDPRLTGIFRRE